VYVDTQASVTQASVALINPPFFLNDFRSPYLSLPHLLGFLHAHGASDIKLVDANMALWQVIRSPEFLNELAAEVHAQLCDQSILPDAARRELIYYTLLLDYLRDDPTRLVNEPASINLFAGVVFDRYYRGMRRNITSQIASLDRKDNWRPLEDVVKRTIDNLPVTTRLVGVTVPTADQSRRCYSPGRRNTDSVEM
jgi:hypothetical protein